MRGKGSSKKIIELVDLFEAFDEFYATVMYTDATEFDKIVA